MVLVGEFNPSSPSEATRLLEQNIEGAEMHVIAGASCISPLKKPDVIYVHLIRFLAIKGHGVDTSSPADH